ncbi:MAG: hypothetical protein WD847_15215 [Pirellulales bacterium]
MLVGGVAGAVLAWMAPGPRGPGAAMAAGALLMVVAVLISTLVFRWRLRVDDQGIARRRLLRWDVWPWEAFRDGRVCKGHLLDSYAWGTRSPLLYYLTHRFINHRELCFGLIAESEQRWLVEICREMYREPPEPEPLNEALLHWWPGRTMKLNGAGIEFTRGKNKTISYPWSDVAEVRIDRLKHDRRDFQKLSMTLPDRKVRLFVNDGQTQWRGPQPEAILALVCRHIAPHRVLLVGRHGAPRSLREATVRLEEARRRARDLRVFRLIVMVLLAILILVLALPPEPANLARAVFGGGMFGIMFVPLLRMLDKQARTSVAELETWCQQAISEQKAD